MTLARTDDHVGDVPDLDVEPPGDYPLRRVLSAAPGAIGRRVFLRVIAAGGMTLGVTVLGWLPPARWAMATVGTEHRTCGVFRYDNMICAPEIYSPDNCGSDGWFRDGCAFSDHDYECYRPVTACDDRNAWRWVDGEVEYRCADGEVKILGAPGWDFRICNAELAAE